MLFLNNYQVSDLKIQVLDFIGDSFLVAPP